MTGDVLLSKPNKRFGFRSANPCVLLISVGVRIVRMKVARTALFLLIRAGRVRMHAQVISKSDVTLDLWRISVEKMKLHDAKSSLFG